MSNIQHSSRTDDWGTPPQIIELVHEVLGLPDLDPASSIVHNQIVKATRIITADQNALTIPWSTTPVSVFCNPPGSKINGKSCTKLFWNKLMALRQNNLLKHAIFMCFSAEALQTTQLDCPHSITEFVVCVPRRRIAFISTDGTKNQPTHANAIVYVPGIINTTHKFAEVFKSVGNIMVTYSTLKA